MPKKFLNGVDLQNQKAINLADGSNPTDAVTLQQLQAAIRGLDWKQSVRAATTANITLSGTQTVDGVALTAGDRVLVKDQTTASGNGIYIVSASTWTRATDYDDSLEVTAATAIPVESGTVNGDAVFILTTEGATTVGTTALNFTRLGGSGVSYTADAAGGLQLSGSAFSIKLRTSSGLIIDANGVGIDPAYPGLAKRWNGLVPNGSATASIVHNLGTTEITGLVLRVVSTGEIVDTDPVIVDANTVNLTFATPPTSGQYRVAISA